jgi:hypothetical protein
MEDSSAEETVADSEIQSNDPINDDDSAHASHAA